MFDVVFDSSPVPSPPSPFFANTNLHVTNQNLVRSQMGHRRRRLVQQEACRIEGVARFRKCGAPSPLPRELRTCHTRLLGFQYGDGAVGEEEARREGGDGGWV